MQSTKYLTKFITRKWIEVHDQSGGSYSTNKQIRFKTTMLQSDLCGYSDTCIVVKGTITVEGANDGYEHNGNLVLKIMLHLILAFQRLIIHLLLMQKT